MRSHGSSLRGFPDDILQGWFKMKTTSIFPVHGLASLILMSKYAQSQQFLRGFLTIQYMDILQKQTVSI